MFDHLITLKYGKLPSFLTRSRPKKSMWLITVIFYLADPIFLILVTNLPAGDQCNQRKKTKEESWCAFNCFQQRTQTPNPWGHGTGEAGLNPTFSNRTCMECAGPSHQHSLSTAASVDNRHLGAQVARGLGEEPRVPEAAPFPATLSGPLRWRTVVLLTVLDIFFTICLAQTTQNKNFLNILLTDWIPPKSGRNFLFFQLPYYGISLPLPR